MLSILIVRYCDLTILIPNMHEGELENRNSRNMLFFSGQDPEWIQDYQNGGMYDGVPVLIRTSPSYDIKTILHITLDLVTYKLQGLRSSFSTIPPPQLCMQLCMYTVGIQVLRRSRLEVCPVLCVGMTLPHSD